MGADSSTTSNRYWFCPLYFLACDCESIDLCEGLQIKRAPVEVINHFREHYTPTGLVHALIVFDWVVSIACSEAILGSGIDNVASGEEEIRAFYLLRSFIEACRLHKKGGITPGPLTLFNLQGSVWSPGTAIEASYLSKISWPWKPKYELHQSDIPEIVELMRDIAIHVYFGPTKWNVLNRALTRFDSAYDGELEDKLIDQMIAFESLYIGDDKELGYKLALRTAFLLGKKKATIFRDMRKAYDLRGQIVHGNKEVDASKLEETIPKTEEYLRQSIRRFLVLLSKGHSLKEIRQKLLDENILKNGRLLALRE